MYSDKYTVHSENKLQHLILQKMDVRLGHSGMFPVCNQATFQPGVNFHVAQSRRVIKSLFGFTLSESGWVSEGVTLCRNNITGKRYFAFTVYLLLSSGLNTVGLFDRDVEQVSNMKEDTRSHLVRQTAKTRRGSANSAVPVPHKAIG